MVRETMADGDESDIEDGDDVIVTMRSLSDGTSKRVGTVIEQYTQNGNATYVVQFAKTGTAHVTADCITVLGDTTHSDVVGKRVRVGSFVGKVREAGDDRSYSVSAEIGGVHQHVTVTAEYAHTHVVD